MAIEAFDGQSDEARARRLMAMPAEKSRNEQLAVAIANWHRIDPKALDYLDQVPPGENHDWLIRQVAEDLAKKDPRKALDFVNKRLDGAAKQEAIKTVLLNLASTEPEKATAMVDEMLPSLSAGMLGNFFVTRFTDALAAKSIDRAREWVATLPASMRQDPMTALAQEWAMKDPVAALEWARRSEIEVMRPLHTRYHDWNASILATAMDMKPDETAAWIRSQPIGNDRDQLVERALLSRVRSKRPEQLNSDDLIWNLFAELPADAQPRTARELGRKQGTRKEFNDVQEWASQFSPGPLQDEAIAGVVETIAARDRTRAERMLEPLTDPRQRDAALVGLVQGLRDNAPELAVTRAAEIGDSNLRFEALDRVVPNWLKRSPKVVRAWFNEAQIPQQWRGQWEREVQRGW